MPIQQLQASNNVAGVVSAGLVFLPNVYDCTVLICRRDGLLLTRNGEHRMVTRVLRKVLRTLRKRLTWYLFSPLVNQAQYLFIEQSSHLKASHTWYV
jgi:hypothetical protein